MADSGEPEFLSVKTLGIKDFPTSMEEFMETLDKLPTLSEAQSKAGLRTSSKDFIAISGSITNGRPESYTSSQILELI
jgi:hypothetical protein